MANMPPNQSHENVSHNNALAQLINTTKFNKRAMHLLEGENLLTTLKAMFTTCSRSLIFMLMKKVNK